MPKQAIKSGAQGREKIKVFVNPWKKPVRQKSAHPFNPPSPLVRLGLIGLRADHNEKEMF